MKLNGGRYLDTTRPALLKRGETAMLVISNQPSGLSGTVFGLLGIYLLDMMNAAKAR